MSPLAIFLQSSYDNVWYILANIPSICLSVCLGYIKQCQVKLHASTAYLGQLLPCNNWMIFLSLSQLPCLDCKMHQESWELTHHLDKEEHKWYTVTVWLLILDNNLFASFVHLKKCTKLKEMYEAQLQFPDRCMCWRVKGGGLLWQRYRYFLVHIASIYY